MTEPQHVRIINKTGVGYGTQIFNADGTEIQGVTTVSVDRFGCEDVVTVNLTISIVDFEIDGKPRWLTADPKTGELRELKALEFANGERVEL